MRVDFSVPEQQIRLIEIGMPVTVTSEVGDTELERHDHRRSSRGSTRTAGSSRCAPRSTNPRASINPGQFLRVRVELPEEPA